MVKNVYPEKPVVAFKATSVTMSNVISYLSKVRMEPPALIAAYIMFRMESGNGKYGVNNNYAGIQADNSRWPEKFDKKIIATCVKKENQTGKERRFCCFDTWQTSVDFLIDRVVSRGLYVGGYTQRIAKMHVNTPQDFARAYYKEWVKGSKLYEPSPSQIADIVSMYRQGTTLFSNK